MPRLYRAGAEWRSSEREAQKLARANGCNVEPVDVTPTVPGLLALLNGRHVRRAAQLAAEAPLVPDGPASPEGEEPWTGARAEIAVKAFVAGRCSGTSPQPVSLPEIQRHLEDVHRIAVSTIWIFDKLRALGWSRHGKTLVEPQA